MAQVITLVTGFPTSFLSVRIVRRLLQSNPDVALRLVEAICSHDVERILSLVTDDHVLIDSGGQDLQGKKVVGVGWTAYFLAFPDYRIMVSEIIDRGAVVALFGTASATFSVEGRLTTT